MFATLATLTTIGLSVFVYTTRHSDSMPWASPISGPTGGFSFSFSSMSFGSHTLEYWTIISDGFAPCKLNKLKVLQWLSDAKDIGLIRLASLPPNAIVAMVKSVGNLNQNDLDLLNRALETIGNQNPQLLNKRSLWFASSFLSFQNVGSAIGLASAGSAWNSACSYSRETAGSFHVIFAILQFICHKLEEMTDIHVDLQAQIDGANESIETKFAIMTATASDRYEKVSQETSSALGDAFAKIEENSARIDLNTSRIGAHDQRFDQQQKENKMRDIEISELKKTIDSMLLAFKSERKIACGFREKITSTTIGVTAEMMDLNQRLMQFRQEVRAEVECKADHVDLIALAKACAQAEELYNDSFDNLHAKALTLKVDVSKIKRVVRRNSSSVADTVCQLHTLRRNSKTQ